MRPSITLLVTLVAAAHAWSQSAPIPVPSLNRQTPPQTQQPAAIPAPPAVPAAASQQADSQFLRQTPKPHSGLALDDLDRLLRAKPEPMRVNFVFTDTDEITESHLIRGAAVAQAVALRAGDRPLTFSYSRQPQDGAFNVMIGTTEALTLYVPADIIQKTTNSLLYIFEYAGPSMPPMLVVSGTTPTAVDNAILALGFVNQELPDINVAYIRGIELPATPPFMRRTPLFPGTTTTLANLQTGGDTLQLAPDGGIIMNVFMSAMAAIPTKAEIQVDLHFLLRQRTFSSTNGLAILLNGKNVASLAPSDISAASGGGSASVISIPVNEFLPGRNELLFQPAGMVGQLASPDTFAIYGDSGIVFPRVEGNVELPSLSTTSRTLFPLVGQPDGSEISILVTAKDRSTVQAAWTFLGKAAQMANTLLYSASVSFTNLNARQHQIIIGPLETLPKEYGAGIMQSWLKKTGQDEEDKILDQQAPVKNLQYFLSEGVAHFFPSREEPKPAADAHDASTVSDAYSAYISSVPNPVTTGRWALILSAIDGPTLEKRTGELILPAFWSQLKGSIVLWSSDPHSLRFFVPGAEEHNPIFGDRDVQLPLGEKMSRNLWAAIGALLFAILVVLTLKLLRQADISVEARKRKPVSLSDES